MVLLPPLVSMWHQRRQIQRLPALLLASFAVVLVVVNSKITAMGMGVEYGWVDHLFLAIACLAVLSFYLLSDEEDELQEFPSLDEQATLDLSIIVPAYNEEERLLNMLEECTTYLAQSDDDFKIIIVDDGSKDGTTEEALKWSNHWFFKAANCIFYMF